MATRRTLNFLCSGRLILLAVIGLAGCWPRSQASEVSEVDPVSWQALALEGGKTLAHVSIAIRLERLAAAQAEKQLISIPAAKALSTPGDPEVLMLSADIRADMIFKTKQWTGQVWFSPRGAPTLQRIRFKPGRKGSQKIYRYARDGVYRKRAEPKNRAEAALPPQKWSKRQDSFFPYGTPTDECTRIVDTFALLYIISANPLAPGERLSLCAFNKKTLYYVHLQALQPVAVKVNYREQRGPSVKTVQGEQEAVELLLTARPVDPDAAKLEPFEFMGLEGEVRLLLARGSAIPLVLTGEIPDLGKTRFSLVRLRLNHEIRQPATATQPP